MVYISLCLYYWISFGPHRGYSLDYLELGSGRIESFLLHCRRRVWCIDFLGYLGGLLGETLLGLRLAFGNFDL